MSFPNVFFSDYESMAPDEILYIGCLRNKSTLKPEEVNVVNKLALEFMEIRIKELEKEEQPTDHTRRLFYRFMVQKYDSSLGPIIQYLAMSGKKKIRDVEWNFFTVVAHTGNKSSEDWQTNPQLSSNLMTSWYNQRIFFFFVLFPCPAFHPSSLITVTDKRSHSPIIIISLDKEHFLSSHRLILSFLS